MPNEFKSGDNFSYNVTNYLLVQKIIEKVSGKDYEEFLLKNQFELAGMEKIYFGNSFDVVKDKCPTYAYYYQDKASQKFIKGNKPLEIKEEFYSNLKTDAGAFNKCRKYSEMDFRFTKRKVIK